MNDAIYGRLVELSESDYKVFNEKLIPTQYEIMGIRMPALKKLAKEIATSADLQQYLDTAEFKTYEQVLLYGLVLGSLKNPPLEMVFKYLDPLILKFDNWAHVDTVFSTNKIFNKYPQEVLEHFLPLKTDSGEFTKRTFVIMLMSFYINDRYIDMALSQLEEVPQGQYYVDMAIAWALSLGVVKYPEKTMPLLEQTRFSKFVHNKAIQKSRESYRVCPQIKEYLQKLKIK